MSETLTASRGQAHNREDPRPSGSANAAIPVAEDPAESALIAAQTLWGRGNLSPLDHQFGTAVVANLVPKGELGFVGQHLGSRLHRYAEDKGIWIDAVEAEPALSQINKKKQSTIKLLRWEGSAKGLRTNRYMTCVATHASGFVPSLEGLYGECANALKIKGTLFSGDVMWTASPGKEAALPDGRVLHSLDEHKAVLAHAGIKVERTLDMTDNVKGAIYAGLAQSIKDLAEWRALPKRIKDQRKAALLTQLELWGTICALIQRKMICIAALIGSKQP